LFQGDAVLSLVHFHPHYDRALVMPVAKPAFGHLPPASWLRPMLHAFGVGQELSDKDLALGNYLRKSPIAAVNIVRNSLLADPKIVGIELNDGTKTQASGLEVYCKNAIELTQMGKDVLQTAHDAEVKIVN
jgi:hypothetical protein